MTGISVNPTENQMTQKKMLISFAFLFFPYFKRKLSFTMGDIVAMSSACWLTEPAAGCLFVRMAKFSRSKNFPPISQHPMTSSLQYDGFSDALF